MLLLWLVQTGSGEGEQFGVGFQVPVIPISE
jgi:hypothetical protein